jgi:GntP family gluconate:H+ symporter
MQAGGTVIDALPHGNCVHVIINSVNMSLGERMQMAGFEALVGLTMSIVASLMYIVFWRMTMPSCPEQVSIRICSHTQQQI